MKHPSRWWLTAGLCLLSPLAGFSQQTAQPRYEVPKTFVGCPEFETRGGKSSAGTACLARLENSPLLYVLTVRHLLGPAGGFPQLMKPDEIPAFVSAIRLQHLFVPGSKIYRVEGLKMPEAADDSAPLYDLCLFRAKEGYATDAGIITLEKPAVGDTVYVIANLSGDKTTGQYLHPVHITDNDGGWLYGTFDDQKIVTRGASGAPVLNKAGKIIGVYAGHSTGRGKGKDKAKKFARMIPSSLIAKVIEGKPLTP